MDINLLFENFVQLVWSWPAIILFVLIGIATTIAYNFVQFRHFLDSIRIVFAKQEKTEGTEISPIQAFISALGSNTGNGSIAGIATGIFIGGPGVAFWLLVAGIFSMAMRFAEVYLATSITEMTPSGVAKGGPMVYLKKVPFGNVLAFVYTVAMVVFGFIAGNAIQSNSITVSIAKTWGFSIYSIAAVLFVFIIYVMLGGSQRMIAISDKLVPFKVGLFLITSITVLIVNYKNILPALSLILEGAFRPEAIGGAVVGFTIQQTIRMGLTKALFSNEAGLGTAAVLFGASGSKHPLRDSIMSMLSVFISTFVVSFLVALTIISSGVWNNGLSSTALTISAFETAFGGYAGWIITFLSASFGLGVIVPFAFITRESWMYLTNNRWPLVFSVLYCLSTVVGCLSPVVLIINIADIINAIIFFINMYPIVYLLPKMRRQYQADVKHLKI
ncbi:MAG: amino acid carrier protein [Candidatus Babeliales bacterium]|nr:amino acid carrier protein [Candidatus Babeliales bacterium]